MTAAITFAIPFHRNEALLRIAVNSVLAQDMEDWRLLVIDDSGMELGAKEMLERLDDPRISYLSNEQNLGMVETWNRCLDHAETDLVNLLHADDALLPNYASLMLDLAARFPEASAFFCETDIVSYDGAVTFSVADTVKQFLVPRTQAPEWVLHGEDAVASLMTGYFIMTPTLCYRKSRLVDQRFDPAYKQVQDLIYIVGLLMADHTIVGTRKCAYAYRRHADSATSVQSESMLRFHEEVAAFDLVAEQARALGWTRAASTAANKRIIKLHLLYRALRELLSLRLSGAAQSVRYLVSII